MSDLIDMLAIQTAEYTRLVKEQGFGQAAIDQKEIVKRIQLAIDQKVSPEKTPVIK